jgi:hypothetical protein
LNSFIFILASKRDVDSCAALLPDLATLRLGWKGVSAAIVIPAPELFA